MLSYTQSSARQRTARRKGGLRERDVGEGGVEGGREGDLEHEREIEREGGRERERMRERE